MLCLAIQTNFNSLLEAAENALMRRLKEDLIHRSITHNMKLAEELGLRRFQSRLYYHELLRQDALLEGSPTYCSKQTAASTHFVYSIWTWNMPGRME